MVCIYLYTVLKVFSVHSLKSILTVCGVYLLVCWTESLWCVFTCMRYWCILCASLPACSTDEFVCVILLVCCTDVFVCASLHVCGTDVFVCAYLLVCGTDVFVCDVRRLRGLRPLPGRLVQLLFCWHVYQNKMNTYIIPQCIQYYFVVAVNHLNI